MTAKITRRDYEVTIQYVPAPGTHVEKMKIINCADAAEAQATAVRDFRAENPGAEVLWAESRATR